MSLHAHQAAQVALVVGPGAAARVAAGDLTPCHDRTEQDAPRLLVRADHAGIRLSRKVRNRTGRAPPARRSDERGPA